MKTIILSTLSLSLIFLFGCTKKKCDSNLEPYSNSLNIVLDSIFKNTEVKKIKCVDNQIHTIASLAWYTSEIEDFKKDTLLVLNGVLKNFRVINPSLIAKVKPRNVLVSLSEDDDTKGSLEVSNYYYDKEKKLGAYFFILMLGQKGMKEFVVFYTIDDDCQVKLLSYKEMFSIPKNPIWVKKEPSGSSQN